MKQIWAILAVALTAASSRNSPARSDCVICAGSLTKKLNWTTCVLLAPMLAPSGFGEPIIARHRVRPNATRSWKATAEGVKVSGMKHNLFIPLILLGLLINWQPLVAHDPDLQATLQKMQDQLEQQQKELAEQRILIQQLQGSQPAAKTGPR